MKNGTPTGFQDKNGAEIKTADHIKNIADGSILVIDKFGKAVSALGFKYELPNMHCSRGMNEDGTYFARLTDYELTQEEQPKPKGEVVTADDVADMAPPAVKDKRDTKPKSKYYKTEAARRRKTSLACKYANQLAAEGYEVNVMTAEDQSGDIRVELDGHDVSFEELETIANGGTQEDAAKMLSLGDYQDEDLCGELRARGYHGEITKTKTIKI